MAVRVLVTDGSSETRDALRCHLECIGCVVVAETETAAHALPLLKTVRPELIVLGADLRDAAPCNTLDLVRLIKREEPQTSVLLIGREISEQDVQIFRQAGVLGSFSAPLEFAMLWRTLSRAYPELMTGAFADMISAAAARAIRASR